MKENWKDKELFLKGFPVEWEGQRYHDHKPMHSQGDKISEGQTRTEKEAAPCIWAQDRIQGGEN